MTALHESLTAPGPSEAGTRRLAPGILECWNKHGTLTKTKARTPVQTQEGGGVNGVAR